MKDSKHRSYTVSPSISKQEQATIDLVAKIRCFIKSTQLNHDDGILLNRLLRNLEHAKLSTKVLRSIETKFEKIRHNYQR